MKLKQTMLLICLLAMNILLGGEYSFKTPNQCEGQYYRDVQATLFSLSSWASPQLLKLCEEYIALVRQQAFTKAKILIKEQMFASLPELLTKLRVPYGAYVACNKIEVIGPDKNMVTSRECENQYYANVHDILSSIDPKIAKPAQEYINLVKQHGDDQKRLLLIESHFLDASDLQGKLRFPFTQYVDCTDVRSVVQLAQ